MHGTGPAYVADELSHSSDFVNRRKLCLASSQNLIVRRTRLSAYGDQVFPVAGPCVFHLTSILHYQSTF